MQKLLFVSVICFVSTPTITAQQTRPTSQHTDVINVDASLVQTSITVFDKRGAFVEGLRPEDFEIRVDGKSTIVDQLEKTTVLQRVPFQID